MATVQANASSRRRTIYRFACVPRAWLDDQPGDRITELARRLGYDLDAIEREDRERALAELHRERDDDQPGWGRS